jgi:nitronate monooxygenase
MLWSRLSHAQELPMSEARNRSAEFCRRFHLDLPILLAPMAGACPPALSIAVAKAGGAGACGALLMSPQEIAAWADAVRAQTDRPFQINLWIPDPSPERNAEHEAQVRAFLGKWGPAVPPNAGDAVPLDFAAQCEALLAARPAFVSSIMGLYAPEYVERLKAAGIAWFATATTVAEAKAAESAGADVILAQGMEAGGHRGCFDAARAEATLSGLFALLPAVVDAVKIPVVATGGIADARGIAAALTLGASAVQVGTGFLRCPEAGIHPAWAEGLAAASPEKTILTRAFSGRAGRSLATDYAIAAAAPGTPVPAPYPVQRGLTATMRKHALETGDLQRMQAWAGQSAGLARAEPAGDLARALWAGAQGLLP